MKNQVAWRQLAVRGYQEKKPDRATTAGEILPSAPKAQRCVFTARLRLSEHTRRGKSLRSTPRFAGEYTARVTPVPIPNTEVKPRWADGTARVSVWERR